MIRCVLLSLLIHNRGLVPLRGCHSVVSSGINRCKNSFRFAFGFSIPTSIHPIERLKLPEPSIFDCRSKMSMSTNNNQETSTTEASIVVVGSANYDITCYTSKIPQPGETVLTDGQQQVDLSCGGKGANQAKAATCLLPLQYPKVNMVCRVGDDIFGHEILNTFHQYGIDFDPTTTIIKTIDNNYDQQQQSEEKGKVVHTGVASIIVDTNTGENQIIVTPGANYAMQPIDVRNAILKYIAANQQRSMIVVLLQLEIPYQAVNEAIKVIRDQQKDSSFIILNPAPVPSDPHVLQQLKDNCFPLVDILIPNETELRQLCSNTSANVNEVELATSLLHAYNIRRAVIVTLGSHGALIVERTRNNKRQQSSDDDDDDTATTTITNTFVQAPPDIINMMKYRTIIDTVGAGDAFCGAIAAYLSATMSTQNSNASLTPLVTMACGYATMSVYRRGTNYPKHNELPGCLEIGTLRPVSSSGVVQQHSRSEQKKKVLTFVTGNAKKLEEVRKILGNGVEDFPYTITNQKIDLPELQGNDVYEIAKEKCRIAAKIIQGPCFIEDTSLCFNALHGLPGPYIKWFLEKCGHDGLNQMLIGFDDNTAYAQTVVAYTDGCMNDNEIHVFDGRTDGTIVLPRGSLDFGWDPIFEPNEGNGLTYAEMEKSSKNLISHRGRSFTKFQKFLMDHRSKEQM